MTKAFNNPCPLIVLDIHSFKQRYPYLICTYVYIYTIFCIIHDQHKSFSSLFDMNRKHQLNPPLQNQPCFLTLRIDIYSHITLTLTHPYTLGVRTGKWALERASGSNIWARLACAVLGTRAREDWRHGGARVRARGQEETRAPRLGVRARAQGAPPAQRGAHAPAPAAAAAPRP